MANRATLADMVGRIIRSRPGLDRSLAVDFLNERLRCVLDRNPDWSGLLTRTMLYIPNAYVLGTISTITGSSLVTGAGTSWPVADAVNTTIVDAINTPGNVWVTPADLTGITLNTSLYIDSAITPETVAVRDIMGPRINITCAFPHAANITATSSSLTGLQLRLGSINPVFTVSAVTSPTSLILDSPWSTYPLSGTGYQILLMYTAFAPDVLEVMDVVDPVQQIKLRLKVQQKEINQYDPNRTATNSPSSIVDLGPNSNGQMLYEVYPPQNSIRQLYVIYKRSWPMMRLPSDLPPPFINENLLIYGGLADAYRTPCPRGPDGKDQGYNFPASEKYEEMFERAYIDNLTSDQSKAQTNFQWAYGQVFGYGMGSNFLRDHDIDSILSNY